MVLSIQQNFRRVTSGDTSHYAISDNARRGAAKWITGVMRPKLFRVAVRMAREWHCSTSLVPRRVAELMSDTSQVRG